MELSAALTAGITDLCASAAADPGTVIDPLRALNRDLRWTTRSYLGLELMLLDDGQAVTLTSFEPGVQFDDIVTSLHLPLTMLGRTINRRPSAGTDGMLDRECGLTVYAGRPGALVDLAADLTYALTPGHRDQTPETAAGSASPPGEVLLDQHLTPRSLTPGLNGSEDATTVNRAVGLLIGQGRTPEEAHRDLANHAARAGVTVLAWSTRLLRPVDEPTP